MAGNTEQQIFAVDANTGQVYLAGNLFVQSADKARRSWILGNMISATSVIELKDGAIVLDGGKGLITVYDPAKLNNGNFVQIENGFVRQYKAYKLIKTLNTIETGICQTGAWKTLSGYYLHRPSVYVSPRLINSFSILGASQDQRLDTFVQRVRQVSAGKWEFLPKAQLMLASGDFFVTPPTIKNYTSAGDDGNHTTTTKTTLTDIITIAGANALTATVEFKACAYYDSGSNSYMGASTSKWRIRYKKTTGSSWNYSSWSETQQTEWNDRDQHRDSMQISFSQGSYNVQFEYQNTVITSGGCLIRFSPGDPRLDLIQSGTFEVKSITLNSSANTLLASGSLNYLAVGE